MKNKNYRYVLLYDDTNEIVEDTIHAEKMLDVVAGLINEMGVTLYKIEVHDNGHIVKTLDNIILNEEILKILRQKKKGDRNV